jgi:hypothetical protein
MNTRTVYVTPHGDRWQVSVDGRRRGQLFESQEIALQAGRLLAHDLRVELVIHGSDGRVQCRERTYLHS